MMRSSIYVLFHSILLLFQPGVQGAVPVTASIAQSSQNGKFPSTSRIQPTEAQNGQRKVYIFGDAKTTATTISTLESKLMATESFEKDPEETKNEKDSKTNIQFSNTDDASTPTSEDDSTPISASSRSLTSSQVIEFSPKNMALMAVLNSLLIMGSVLGAVTSKTVLAGKLLHNAEDGITFPSKLKRHLTLNRRRGDPIPMPLQFPSHLPPSSIQQSSLLPEPSQIPFPYQGPINIDEPNWARRHDEYPINERMDLPLFSVTEMTPLRSPRMNTVANAQKPVIQFHTRRVSVFPPKIQRNMPPMFNRNIRRVSSTNERFLPNNLNFFRINRI